MNFWDYNVWGIISILAVLLISLLVANLMKRRIPLLKKSLIPTSVLAGLLILVVSSIYTIATGEYLFELEFFGSPSGDAIDTLGEAGLESSLSASGLEALETITYHALALGFIATAFKPAKEKLSKKRSTEVFNTGVTTVSTYLMQAVLGMAITMIAALFIDGLANYGGVILAFGYGQGTGQALNYGKIYQAAGFDGGADFGLSIASLGFISAAIGGVIYLNIIKKKTQKKLNSGEFAETMTLDKVQASDEIPLESSGVDKTTIQLAFVLGTYFIAYLIIKALTAIPFLSNDNMKGTIYGFNFLIGVLVATLVCAIMRFCKKKGIIKREYINHFLMKRIAGFFFDLMIISGFAAIKPDTIAKYWHVLLIMGVVGALSTFFYIKFVSKKLFPEYADEQFLAMYGMLTGTASTGIILLREWDNKFETPVADNLVYQNLPAIIFGLPIMLLAAVDVIGNHTILVFIALIVLFIALNIILFRSYIFKRKKRKVAIADSEA